MLNVDRFLDQRKGTKVFLGLLEFFITKEGRKVTEKEGKEKKRLTSYFDTQDLALRRNGFSLRIREELDEHMFQVNLKYRAADRYISAAQNVTSPETGETKGCVAGIALR